MKRTCRERYVSAKLGSLTLQVGDNVTSSGALTLNPVAAFEWIQRALCGGITLYAVGTFN